MENPGNVTPAMLEPLMRLQFDGGKSSELTVAAFQVGKETCILKLDFGHSVDMCTAYIFMQEKVLLLWTCQCDFDS